jgi:hypothetical protein
MNTCILCGRTFTEPPCNPRPLSTTGVACPECDDLKVTPARLVASGIPPAQAEAVAREMHERVKGLRERIRKRFGP